MIRRFLAVLRARNLEFIRDRSSLGWNVAFPLLLIAGLWAMFSGDGPPAYKAGVVGASTEVTADHPFLYTRYTHFTGYPNRDAALALVADHELDIVVEFGPLETRYWVNTTSPKGYALERFLLAAGGEPKVKVEIEGESTRYIDWLVPGVLGMSMMFSCLFGIGYVVVRYRKNGYLKRLYATPLTAFEFIAAQIASRLFLVLVTNAAVFAAMLLLLDIRMEGEAADLLVVAALGAMSMIALGLTVGAYVTSEELAGGLLNLITWPMMLMSGVWFSLEGLGDISQTLSLMFPLTHMLDAARAIVLEGADLAELWTQLAVLTGMTTLFIAVSALLFRWKDV